jgi:hypothetical protein
MWCAILNDGCFEAETLEQLTIQIGEYYAENDRLLPDIESIENDNQSLSTLGLQKFYEACESEYEAEIEEIAAEKEYQRQVRSDYYSNIL